MSRNDIPNSKAPNFQERVRETLMTYLGRQGNALDRGLTVRDLIDAGIIKFKNGFGGVSGGGSLPIEPGEGVGGGVEPDFTPPPMVAGFTAIGAVNHIFVEHGDPTYNAGHGHDYTILYGKIRSSPLDPPPVFQTPEELAAKIEPEIARFSGTTFAYPTDPGTTWHLWARWVTKDGVRSTYPAGGTNGVVATSAYDAAKLVEAVQGVITESDLYRVLSDDESMADAVGRLRGVVSTHKVMQETLAATATVAESVNVEVDALSGSLAQKVAVLEAKFGSNVASLQQSFETTADALGHVGSQYTVRSALTSNGTTVVGGFGLVGTSNENAPPTFDFGVLANKFFIAAPATHNLPSQVPFTVITTTTSDGDGGTIPPGVYIDGAYIKGGSISGAAITGGTITGTKLIDVSANKLTAGALKVGEYIQSAASYDYGSGLEPIWKIDGSGNAKLNNATMRGTVFASAGQIGGITIASNAVRAGQTAFDTGNGFYLGADGKFSLGNGTQRLTWNGSALTIKGNLDGATGTFSGLYTGTLNASQINAGLLQADRIESGSIGKPFAFAYAYESAFGGNLAGPYISVPFGGSEYLTTWVGPRDTAPGFLFGTASVAFRFMLTPLSAQVGIRLVIKEYTATGGGGTETQALSAYNDSFVDSSSPANKTALCSIGFGISLASTTRSVRIELYTINTHATKWVAASNISISAAVLQK